MFKAKEVKDMDIGKDIRETVMKYSDMLYKICIVILCNEQDELRCRAERSGDGGRESGVPG